MAAIPIWSVPTVFDLTNPYSGILQFNVEDPESAFLVNQAGCQFKIGVRSTTDNVPQSDGSILHHRFLTGTQIAMTVELWVNDQNPACSEILVDMLDMLMGSLRSLLNAGDNEGRLSWTIPGGNTRMLDDVRLLEYPVFAMNGAVATVSFVLDSQYPYAQDLTQISTDIADGATETLDNEGTADYFPVFKVFGPTSAFTLENLTTGIQIEYNAALPDAVAIGGGDYAEINTFTNEIFLNGDGANLKAGIMQLASDYPSLVVGENDVTIDGASAEALWAPAWG